MKTYSLVGALALAGPLLLASCSEGGDASPTTGADPELVQHLDREFGLSLAIVSSAESTDADGALRLDQTLRVTLAGHGTREIRLDETVWPDGLTALFISDLETQDQRYFAWHVNDGFIAFGTNDRPTGENANVEVVPVEGGRYGVRSFDDTDVSAPPVEAMGDGRAAVDTVEAEVRFADVAPHILMTAFALAHTPAPEARAAVNCSQGDLAAAPTVCAIFEDFCNCAPCLVLGDPAVCQKWCPSR